jgi:biotin synthase
MNDTEKRIDTDFLLNAPLLELVALAAQTRKKFVGTGFELCSIINAKSGRCGEDCKFCAQSARHRTGISVYPLKDKAQIAEAAQKAKENGAQRFGIVTSGNRLKKTELDDITEAIALIKNIVEIDVCCSLGALEKGELTTLKEAGLGRYHHNIETSQRFYPEVVSTHSFEERLNTIRAAKEAGLEVCCGGIIGMGENWQDRIDMAVMLAKLEVDSVPINFLIPIKGTALEKLNPIFCADAVRTLCIFRIILKDRTIKLAAGRESVLKDFQALGLMAGANGMLIGGYLTVKGRDVAEDHKLVREIEKIWSQ